jgi:transcriptional regulator with XRE-family HTH domain
MAARSPRERTAFGQRLVAARKAAKLTQVQVFERIGIPQSTLAELESTATKSGYTAQLAALYEVDAHVLATGEPAPTPSPESHLGPSAAAEPRQDYIAFTEQERQVIADLRELLEDDRLRFVEEIAARAEQMRRHLARITAVPKSSGYTHPARIPPETLFLEGGKLDQRQAPAPAKKAES